MAVIRIDKQTQLRSQLTARYFRLVEELAGRELASPDEGAGDGAWTHPEHLRWIDATELRLAIGDFNTILSELKKIK